MTTTDTNKQARVYRLCQELEEAKIHKKAVSRAANDEIKRIQAEIKELLESEVEQLP